MAVDNAVAGPQPVPLLAMCWLARVQRAGWPNTPCVVVDGSSIHLRVSRALSHLISQLKRG